MKFPLNGKDVTPKVNFGLALALMSCTTESETIITMFDCSLGMDEKELIDLPLSCINEVTDIVNYLNSELEK